MLAEYREVHRGEELRVPQLDRVPPFTRQRAEELVEARRERLGRHSAPPADGLELEDERARVLAEVALVRLVHGLEEYVRIKEIGIDLTGACLVLRFREGVHRELVPDLAHAFESGREIAGVRLQDRLRGRGVEAGIDSDGPEERKSRIFLQHPGRGAATLVLAFIYQPAPARIVPRRGAEAHLRRQPGRQCPELVDHRGTILNTRPSALRTYSSPAASRPNAGTAPPGASVGHCRDSAI